MIHISKKPYMSKNELATEFSASTQWVNKMLREMRDYIPGRYPDEAIIDGNKLVRINLYAFSDYVKYRTWLKNPSMKRMLKPFSTQKWARMWGKAI